MIQWYKINGIEMNEYKYDDQQCCIKLTKKLFEKQYNLEFMCYNLVVSISSSSVSVSVSIGSGMEMLLNV